MVGGLWMAGLRAVGDLCYTLDECDGPGTVVISGIPCLSANLSLSVSVSVKPTSSSQTIVV